MPPEEDLLHSMIAQDCTAEDRVPSERTDQSVALTRTIRKFADAAAQAGIDLETLIAMLESGVPMQSLFELIQSGRTPVGENSGWKVAD